MCILIKKGMISGVSYISNRYSKANNEYLKSYDPKQELKHFIYLDANNLYDYAMSKFRSTSGFKWIDPKEFNLDKYANNSSKGCVLEVDHEYPKELRELHKDYPFEPDKIEIKREMVSDYQLRIADFYNTPIDNVKKLPNFFDQEKCHSLWKLATVLNIRIEAEKIHPVLEFSKSQWLKEYVELNTQKRIEAEKKMVTKMEKHCTN